VSTARRRQVIYGNDPLCGWCFATGPQIQEAWERTRADVDWRIECGGLVVGDRVRPIALDREYLRAGHAQVERVSGRRAGAAYYDELLADGTWVSDSEPSCRAVLVARDLDADVAIPFSHGLTEALYVEGRAPDADDTLYDVGRGVGLDGDELLRRFHGERGATVLRDGFARARALGVTTYPSVFVDDGSGPVEVVAGFAPADEIVARVTSRPAA
jgi:putative protein-disulfide isomerase